MNAKTAGRSVRSFLDAWRVALRVVRLTFRAQLEYRGEFLLSVALGVVWQLSIIVFATVLLGRFAGMGGWPSDAVLLVVAMRLFSHGLYVVLLGQIYELPFIVQEGQLDGYLLRPMPVYRQVLLSRFPANGLGDLLVGASMFAVAVWRIDLDWTWGKALFAAAGVAGGTLMEAAIFTAISAAAFRYPATYYWTSWAGELMGTFGNYPLKILPAALHGLLTFVLPLAFIAYLPAAVLTGNTEGMGVPFAVAAASPLIALAAFVGSRLLWNWALRHYTGVNG